MEEVVEEREEQEGQPEPIPEPAPRPARRRGRTALLICTAAVLGLVAGTCTGYLIQADRTPTKLPPLSQPVLKQSTGKGPEPLSAAQDRKVRTDGDLRKLLLKKPAGAKDVGWPTSHDGWMDLAEYADMYTKPGDAFGDLVADEFRRAAVTAWDTGDTTVEIRLIQFRQEEATAATEYDENARYWAEDQDDTDSWPLPGTAKGMVYVHRAPVREAGYEPYYTAQASAHRGDIAVEVWISGDRPVSKKAIMDLAKRQMERL
ncbi:hypothetical protein [Streptomyces griseosporeus]|uniref:hypothetical protein n=1 Tax=Streptomyces griseosporeus TaxID=1910 RepID=UPI0036FF8832